MAKQEITIRDLAKLAGVSRGTVDKVIHGRTGVSDPVRAHIQELIDQYGYHPRHINEAAPQRTIAVILPRQDNIFFEQMLCGMKSVCTTLPTEQIHVEYHRYDTSSAPELLTILSKLAARGVDGIALRGMYNSQLCQHLNELADKGIPVLLYDSDVPNAKRMCMVAEDSLKSGRLAASLLMKSINSHGEVAIVGGSPKQENHFQRVQGFQDVIRERYPQAQLVGIVDSFDSEAIAYEETVKLLHHRPGLRGIFSVIGKPGAVGQAVLDCHMSHIKIVSYNFTPDVAALIKRGIIDFTIGIAPFRQGQLVMNTLASYILEGKLPTHDFLEVPTYIGVDENIDLLIRENYI